MIISFEYELKCVWTIITLEFDGSRYVAKIISGFKLLLMAFKRCNPIPRLAPVMKTDGNFADIVDTNSFLTSFQCCINHLRLQKWKYSKYFPATLPGFKDLYHSAPSQRFVMEMNAAQRKA